MDALQGQGPVPWPGDKEALWFRGGAAADADITDRFAGGHARPMGPDGRGPHKGTPGPTPACSRAPAGGHGAPAAAPASHSPRPPPPRAADLRAMAAGDYDAWGDPAAVHPLDTLAGIILGDQFTRRATQGRGGARAAAAAVGAPGGQSAPTARPAPGASCPARARGWGGVASPPPPPPNPRSNPTPASTPAPTHLRTHLHPAPTSTPASTHASNVHRGTKAAFSLDPKALSWARALAGHPPFAAWPLCCKMWAFL